MIKLFDWLNQSSLDLHFSLEAAGYAGLSLVLNDDGCLPEGFSSPYSYFCQMGGDEISPLYFNQVPVPEFWQITGTNTQGEIWNYSEKKANIFYHEPKHFRLVKNIDWLDKEGKVYLTDHYNQFGWIFARTYFAKDQKICYKKYFNKQGQEVLSENVMTGDVLLNWQEQVHHFANKTDFLLFYLKLNKFEESNIWYNSLSTPFVLSYYLGGEANDILFWQEKIGDEIPGNMKIILSQKASRTKHILVQNRDAYEKLLTLLSPEEKEMVSYLGFLSPEVRSNQNRKEILILTNSDQLEGFDILSKELADYRFHIAALTEMSQKLMAFGDLENIILYPNVAPQVVDKLFEVCDIYLDINHGGEILSATRRAYESNLVIAAFENTVHHRSIVLKEAIFSPNQSFELAAWLQKQANLQDTSDRQRHEAGQESVDRYRLALERFK